MSIIYDDQFEDPQFESVRLNGHDAAWDLWIEGEEHGEVITFQNGHTVEQRHANQHPDHPARGAGPYEKAVR